MSIDRNPRHVITRMDDEPVISVIAGRANTSEPILFTAIAGSAFGAIGGRTGRISGFDDGAAGPSCATAPRTGIAYRSKAARLISPQRQTLVGPRHDQESALCQLLMP